MCACICTGISEHITHQRIKAQHCTKQDQYRLFIIKTKPGETLIYCVLVKK